MLSNAPKGKIVTTVTENDLEAVAFQKQLVEVFNSAGFAAKAESVMMMSGPSGAPVGLILQIHSELSVPPHAQAIGDALSKVGLNPKTAVSPTTEDGMLFIVVGARPL